MRAERAHAFTGLAMRARLVVGLGPRRAWRVAQVVRRAGGPLSGTDLGRREALRRGGALLAGLALGPRLGGVTAAEPQPKGPPKGHRHPLQGVQVRKSVRLSGPEAEEQKARVLGSADIAHIQATFASESDEAVVYRHDLTDGNQLWAVAFAAPENGGVLHAKPPPGL